MREIILDTETTGLDPGSGDRIVEIGAIELIHHIPTGRYYHQYINPERDMSAEAFEVHGLGTELLRTKPVFAEIVDELLAFLGDAVLIFHNAAFDIAFLNAELGYTDRPPIGVARVIDSLQLTRQKHPMTPNSLDALCKRYGIDNSRREKHGALLDAELLAEVYIELIGGRQPALTLSAARPAIQPVFHGFKALSIRPNTLPPRISEAEIAAHKVMIASLGRSALWLAYEETGG